MQRHKRHRFDPWLRKIPWRRAWQPTPVFLAWRIPSTKEPGRLQSVGPQRVGHNQSDLAHTYLCFYLQRTPGDRNNPWRWSGHQPHTPRNQVPSRHGDRNTSLRMRRYNKQLAVSTASDAVQKVAEVDKP